jgi:hypothetical protein
MPASMPCQHAPASTQFSQVSDAVPMPLHLSALLFSGTSKEGNLVIPCVETSWLSPPNFKDIEDLHSVSLNHLHPTV